MTEDEPQRIKFLKEQAEAGDTEAMLTLAFIYYEGAGTKKDPEQSFYWLEKAADEEIPKAMLMLALSYGKGEGTGKDETKFFHWAMKAAEAGMRDAMFIIVFAYGEGYGTERDWEQCFHWMERYSKEKNVEADTPIFFNLIEKSAKEGEPKAMFYLAFAYVTRDDTKENLDKYFHWMEKAYRAKAPHTFICVSCALLLKEGLITKNKHNEIVKILLKLQQKCKTILRDSHDIEESCLLSHYTKFAALNSILEGKDSNYFRLYNIIYFNDPLEGMFLPDFFADDMCEYIYGSEDQSPHEIRVEDKLFSVYACAFTEVEDRLDMWRAYSNNGDGYSITHTYTIPEDDRDAEEHGLMEKMIGPFLQANLDKLSASDMPEDEDNAINIDKQSRPSSQDVQSKPSESNVSKDNGKFRIYKVLYGEAAEETYKRLEGSLKELQSLLMGINDEKVFQTIKNLAVQILAELRYLYKDKPYKSEQEYRIIDVVDAGNKKLEYDYASEPPHLYTKTEPFLFKENGWKITIGPRVKDKDGAKVYIKHQLHKNDWSETTKIVPSGIRYR